MLRTIFVFLAAGSAALFGQTGKPVQAQAASTVNYSVAAIEIQNVSFQVTNSFISGRPKDERLLLRKTVHSKETVGDIGGEGTVTLESWPLGTDLRQKPLYTLKVTGGDGQVVDNALFVVSRGLEEVEWWTAYKLGLGQRLFDTYVPLVSFSLSKETVQTRYVGLDVPPDDTKDARLKHPNVVGVLTYASEEKVIREVLLTCDDPKRAQLLRSFADSSRKLTLVERPNGLALSLVIRENFPSPPNPVEMVFPIAGDDLDVVHAQLPSKLHATNWRR